MSASLGDLADQTARPPNPAPSLTPRLDPEDQCDPFEPKNWVEPEKRVRFGRTTLEYFEDPQPDPRVF
jgi:hypothetical protein